jgi:hypothetical protein
MKQICRRRKRMRKPILFIQGAGNKHKPLGSGKLIAYLQKQLGGDYEVLAPDMPDPDHPRYLPWRDQIEQELGKLDADVLIIGHSLYSFRKRMICSMEQLQPTRDRRSDEAKPLDVPKTVQAP